MAGLIRGSRTLVVVALFGGFVALSTRPSPAQNQGQTLFDAQSERQAIYAVYDGYMKNEDGTLTLSFAYFSHNATPVTIPSGPDNWFAPGPADRGQPTTFYPGHHRWQCIIVVGPEFEGNLRWTLSHAGTTTATSESMLQYNWEFADRDKRNALRDIEDIGAVPRGECINRPPIVRVLGMGGRRGLQELTGTVGEGVKLFGSVRDEGLPKDGILTSMWRKVSGPGAVTFEDADRPRTLVFVSEPGTYELELAGSDSVLENTYQVTLVVGG